MTEARRDMAVDDVIRQAVDGPIEGWKVGVVWWPGGGRRLRLSGVGRPRDGRVNPRVYDVDDVARCALGGRHVAPEDSCTCGFWSVSARDELGIAFAGTDPSWVDLEIESFGRVVVHERGLRSERQRVMSVRVDDRCVECGRTACVLGADRPGAVTPRCRLHRPSPATGWSGSTGDVAASLGTEVRVDRRAWSPHAPRSDRPDDQRRRSRTLIGVVAMVIAPLVAIAVLREAALPDRACPDAPEVAAPTGGGLDAHPVAVSVADGLGRPAVVGEGDHADCVRFAATDLSLRSVAAPGK